MFEGWLNYYLSSHFTAEETGGGVSRSPMTRLNQTFDSLSGLCESPSFSAICLKLKNTFEVVNELWPQIRTNAYWNQCHKIVSTSQDPIFNLTWKIVPPAITDCFPQTSERGNTIKQHGDQAHRLTSQAARVCSGLYCLRTSSVYSTLCG